MMAFGVAEAAPAPAAFGGGDGLAQVDGVDKNSLAEKQPSASPRTYFPETWLWQLTRMMSVSFLIDPLFVLFKMGYLL